MIRKFFKWIGYFLLGLMVVLAGVYIYISMQTGTSAVTRPIFERENARFMVFAHRGGGGLFPENTLDAFKDSAKLGVDFLELDVHATADGALVVMHDAAVDRTTDGRGKISEMTLDAAKKLDAGDKFSPDDGTTFPFRGKGVTIPTLGEVFDALPEMNFNIEPKQQMPSIIKPLCSLIRARKMTEKIIVGSFNQKVIDEFRAECPEVATSASPKEVSEFLALSKTGLSKADNPPMQALQVPEGLGKLSVITKDFVTDAHRKNLKVHVWTVNDAEEMRNLIEMGVDGIMTDYPDRLLELLGRKPQN